MTRKQYMKKYGRCNQIKVGLYLKTHNKRGKDRKSKNENGEKSSNHSIIGRCKDCKHFEYDSVAKIDGVPLIIAHEICSKWGDGCKTKENGYCFLFEPRVGDKKSKEV